MKSTLYGLAGVFCFALTLPATKLALQHFDPQIIGLARGFLAGIVALLLLITKGEKLPNKRDLKKLLIVASGVVMGFPILSSYAMQYIDASHGAVLIGILPLLTAIIATLRGSEKPPVIFWILSIIGALMVVGYSIKTGHGSISWGDALLFLAIFIGALGYVEGGILAKKMGGWKVISWALVVSLPFVSVPFLLETSKITLNASWASWTGLIYVCLISQFIAFFFWYKGLAIGGVSKVSQLQLLQPMLTILIAVIFLGEFLSSMALITLATILPIVLYIQKIKIQADHQQ